MRLINLVEFFFFYNLKILKKKKKKDHKFSIEDNLNFLEK